jgi:glutathione S-transferase
MRLYDNGASSNAMKVRMLLAELGEAYERRRVPLARPRPDWYVERYRFGTVPFLEDGALKLGESNAILRYLAQSRGRTDLYPAEPRVRARVDWALDAWSTQIRGGLFPAEQIGLMHTDWEQGGGRWEDADQDALAEAL